MNPWSVWGIPQAYWWEPYWCWIKSWRNRFTPTRAPFVRVLGSVRMAARAVRLSARTATVRSASRWHGGRPKRR